MKLHFLSVTLVAMAALAGCSEEKAAPATPEDTGCGLFCLDDTGTAVDTSDDTALDTTDGSATDTGGSLDTGNAADREAAASEVRALCLAQRRHLCRLASDCEGLAGIRAVFEQLGGIDTASCAEAISGILTPDCDWIVAGIETGRATVDRAAVSACLPELASEDCATQVSGTLPVETACSSGVPGVLGQQAAGAACATHVECASGLRCTSNGVEGVDGQCETAEGAACSLVGDCPNAFFCDGVTTSTEGIGACTARLGEGARCSDPNACLPPFACLRLGETDPGTGQPYVATCGRLAP